MLFIDNNDSVFCIYMHKTQTVVSTYVCFDAQDYRETESAEHTSKLELAGRDRGQQGLGLCKTKV